MEHIGFGLEITVLGMGIVFTLLALLWGILALLLRFDTNTQAADAEEQLTQAQEIAASASEAIGAQIPMPARLYAGLDPDTVSAIMIAVLTHKKVRRLQAAPVMRSYWPGSLLYASRWVATGRARQNRSWQRRG